MTFDAFQVPPEIISKIWTYFNRADLLNLRLVSRSWNKKSLRILQNSSFRLHLYYYKTNENGGGETDQNCLEKFLEFATIREIKFPQFVLPFVLHFKGSKYDKIPDHLNSFISNVQILLELFGQTCVKHLEIWTFSGPELGYESVLKLLALLSNGLEEFRWQRFEKTQETLPIAIGEEVLKNHTDLNFPKLNRLALTSYTCENNSFWKFFMPKAPLLNEIELEICSGSHEWTWPISLSVNLVSKLKVKDFKHSTSILQKFGQNTLNMAPLQKLEMNLNIVKFHVQNSEESSRTRKLFGHFASTLECLILKIDTDYRERNPRITEYKLPFPIFPKLRYLKITNFYDNAPIRLVLNESNLFPVLEDVEIQHDLLLLFKDDLELGMVFSSVKFITLLISPINQVLLDHDKYMDEFLSQFPRLNKMTLVNDFINAYSDRWSKDGGMIKCVLNGLIKSNQAKRLKEIELVDCVKNYLGITLHQMYKGTKATFENLPTDPDYLKNYLIQLIQTSTGIADLELTECKNKNGVVVTSICSIPQEVELDGLKIIRLSTSMKGKQRLKLVPLSQEELHIADMSRACPTLEQIHISPFLMAQGQDTEAQAEVLQDISTQFPKIRVNFG